MLTEGQRALNDLLRAADGEWSVGHELLQRGRMAVDRSVVEVGTELVDRVLSVRPNEYLPAQPDDGLVGPIVAVVLEPVR